MKDNQNIIKVVLAVLFLICLFDLPYGLYQLIRFLGMVGFAVLAYNEYQKNQSWFITWLASAILINPIFKIYLGKQIWVVVDIIWVTILIFSILWNPKRKTNERRN